MKQTAEVRPFCLGYPPPPPPGCLKRPFQVDSLFSISRPHPFHKPYNTLHMVSHSLVTGCSDRSREQLNDRVPNCQALCCLVLTRLELPLCLFRVTQLYTVLPWTIISVGDGEHSFASFFASCLGSGNE